MTTTAPQTIGSNKPPLDHGPDLIARIEREYAALFTDAAALDATAFKLPSAPENDEEVALVQDHVIAAKKVAKRVEAMRKAEGRPYLDATDALNDLASELSVPIGKLVEGLTARVGIYSRAKTERERAERLAREAEERRIAEEQRKAEEAARLEAERLQRESEAAAARIRAAEGAEARAKAEKEMRDAETAAAEQRKQAEAASEAAAKSERRADTAGRAAEGDVGKLSKVSAGGSTSSVTKKWVGEITNWSALRVSLGPLEPWITDQTIEDAVARAVRLNAQTGSIESLKLPGVDIHTEDKTNITAARGQEKP
jgi:hypothetical protein